jgi:hypothetical protein
MGYRCVYESQKRTLGLLLVIHDAARDVNDLHDALPMLFVFHFCQFYLHVLPFRVRMDLIIYLFVFSQVEDHSLQFFLVFKLGDIMDAKNLFSLLFFFFFFSILLQKL